MFRRVTNNVIKQVKPEVFINKHVKVNKDMLCIADKHWDLDRNVAVIGFGKASLGMFQSLSRLLGDHITHSYLSVPYTTDLSSVSLATSTAHVTPDHVTRAARNNLPDANTVSITRDIINCVQSLSREHLCICLISGGGSALLCEPKIPLQDMLDTIKLLVSHSATIHQLNTVRKYLCGVKGGGLASYISAGNVISLVVSDVIGDDLGTIASGPTYPHIVSRSDVMVVLKELNIPTTSLSPSVIQLLDVSIATPDITIATPRVTDDITSRHYNYEGVSCNHILFHTQNIYNFVIGSNKLALRSALQEVQQEGYTGVVLTDTLSGEARDVGEDLAKLAEHLISGKAPDATCYKVLSRDVVATATQTYRPDTDMCFILGGETTVTINGTGVGGRCQELALSAGVQLHALHSNVHYRTSVLVTSTDGQDGPTDSCGAYVTQDTHTESLTQQLDMRQYLDNNDSHSFFSLLNGSANLLKTGMTGTNVMDIVFVFIKRL